MREVRTENDERLDLLLRATRDAVWDFDLRTQRLWQNAACESLFRSDDEWKAGLHPEDSHRVLTACDGAMETGAESISLDYRFRRADGTYAFVLERALIVRDQQKRPIRIVRVLTDVTELKEIEEQRLAAPIAHEFNNVLMGIQPNVELLKRKAPEELRAIVERIVGAVERGKRITGQILRKRS
jgi:PAS domain S-box-containing protein